MAIVRLEDADASSGSKAMGLAFLLRAGLPVPGGFVLAHDAFQKFADANGLAEASEAAAHASLEQLPLLSSQLQQRIIAAPLPDFLERQVREAYEELSYGRESQGMSGVARELIRSGRELAFVSVRPSFVAPSGAQAASTETGSTPRPVTFAGMGLSANNIRGFRILLEAIKRTWASAFAPASLRYHQARNLGVPQPAIIVQRSLDPEKSGAFATADPLTGDLGTVLLEASWGLGDPVTSGALIPDCYRAEKATGTIQEKRISEKPWLLRRDAFAERTVKDGVLRERIAADVLSADEVRRLCEVAQTVERAYGRPVEVEWAVERGRLFLVQLRSMTFSAPQSERSLASLEAPAEPRATGIPAAPGSARALAIPVSGDLAASAQKLILAPRGDRELLALIPGAAGIILGTGGTLSAAAVLARELSIPCITGVSGLETLSGELVLDGAAGTIASPARALPVPVPVLADALADDALGTELFVLGSTPAPATDGLLIPADASISALADDAMHWFLADATTLSATLERIRPLSGRIGLVLHANAAHEFRQLRSRVDIPVRLAALVSTPAAALAAGELAAEGAAIFLDSDQLAAHAQAGAPNEAGLLRLFTESIRAARAAGGKAYFLGSAALPHAGALVEAGARGFAVPTEALPALRTAARRAERRLLLERARP